jgi:hypothetical protein
MQGRTSLTESNQQKGNMNNTNSTAETKFAPYMVMTASGNIYRVINEGVTKSGAKCLKVRQRFYRGCYGNNGVAYDFESPIFIKAAIVVKQWSVKYLFPIGYESK